MKSPKTATGSMTHRSTSVRAAVNGTTSPSGMSCGCAKNVCTAPKGQWNWQLNAEQVRGLISKFSRRVTGESASAPIMRRKRTELYDKGLTCQGTPRKNKQRNGLSKSKSAYMKQWRLERKQAQLISCHMTLAFHSTPWNQIKLP